MSDKERKFTVVISTTEYKQLCNWVLKFENLETGGDLFGLWLDKHTAVMQLVLGPGEDCRRTGHSFFQDVGYLGEVGSYLTHKEGLCHIGEWHSHHKLGLTRPSGGDENTVWSNMPTYALSRFVLFIATIGRDNAVNVGCFLFETDPQMKRRFPVLRGNFQLLPDHSPFRSKVEISQVIREKAESLNTDVHLLQIKENKKDFLVSKPRRDAEKSTQKRIRSIPNPGFVEERSEEVEEPQRKRTAEAYSPLKEKEGTRSGECPSVPRVHNSNAEKRQHPFSPDTFEATAANSHEYHVLTSGDGRSEEKEKAADKRKKEENVQSSAQEHIQSGVRKVATLVTSEKNHGKDKKKTYGTCSANAAAVLTASPGVPTGSHDAPPSATDEPGTPSGTIQPTVLDDEPVYNRSGWSCFCGLWSKRKAT